jgi:opacity protein-like surface antigen
MGTTSVFCKEWRKHFIALLLRIVYIIEINPTKAFSPHNRSAFMKLSCKHLFSACFLLALPGAAFSAEVSVDATSIVRIEKRADTGFAKKDIVPATQFLGLDVDKLADGNLSLHLSGWGREDIRDKSFDNDQATGSLTYGYLQYRLNKSSDARLGRFFVHEGIINEQVDGLSARADLPLGFGLSAFGGANVHTKKLFNEKSDGKGEAIYGGRANYRYKGMLELGASGLYETKAPVLTSMLDDGITHRYTNGNRRLVGGDVWFSPFKLVEAMGHTSFNTETKGVAEHTYLLNVKPLHHLVLTGEFNEHRERNFLYSWTMFSGAALNPAEKSRSVGGSASYEITKAIEVAADYKHYKRDIGNADRYGADVKLSFLDNSVRSGLGYHYLHAGKEFAIGSNPSASYHELRVYALHDTKTYFSAVDLLDYIFKDRVYSEKSAWEAIGSLGYHLTPDLAVSGDFSYGRNPQFIEEIKGLVRITYNMTFDSKSKGGMK